MGANVTNADCTGTSAVVRGRVRLIPAGAGGDELAPRRDFGMHDPHGSLVLVHVLPMPPPPLHLPLYQPYRAKDLNDIGRAAVPRSGQVVCAVRTEEMCFCPGGRSKFDTGHYQARGQSAEWNRGRWTAS